MPAGCWFDPNTMMGGSPGDTDRPALQRLFEDVRSGKRKGLWVGGMAPLGYDTKDRKIIVNEAEAERVRDIFQGYLKLGSLNLLMGTCAHEALSRRCGLLRQAKPLGA